MTGCEKGHRQTDGSPLRNPGQVSDTEIGDHGQHHVSNADIDRARVASIQPTACSVVIMVAPVGRGRFRASYGGRLLVSSSTTPFLDAARVLAGEGVDPGARIVMRHEGQSYDALISTVAAAAKLTVKESTGDGKPRFGNWHPYGGPGVPVTSPISETELAGVSPHADAPALPAVGGADGEAEMGAPA